MIYRFDNFELEPELFELRKDGRPISVERRVLDLILYLVASRDRVVPRDELTTLLWPDVVVNERHSLDQAVYAARRALGDQGSSPQFIATVRRRGFRFVASVSTSIRRSRSFQSSPPPLFGRERELERLDACLELTRAGQPYGVVLAGEAGIGKTRLAERVVDLAREQRCFPVLARCDSDEAVPDFWPWVQIVRALSERFDSRFLDQQTEASATLARWVGLESSLQKSARTDHSSLFPLFDLIQRTLSGLANEHPLVLVFDDVQFADAASLRLLEFLSTAAQAPLMLMCTCRTGIHARDSDLVRRALSSLHTQRPGVRIELAGLAYPDVEAWLSDRVESSERARAASLLVKKTGGNPFFLQQLVPFIDSSTGSLPPGIPATLADAIRARLDSIGMSTRQILDAASVLTPPFQAQAVATIGEFGEEEATNGLLEAQEGGIVNAVVEQGFHFSHSILRDFVYQSLSAGKRRTLHARAGEWFASLDPVSPGAERHEAFHLVRALPKVPRSTAQHALERAATASLENGEFDAAARWFAQCAEIAETEADRARYTLERGEALVRAGSKDQGRSLVLESVRRAPASDLSEAALRLAPGFFAIAVGATDVFVEDLLRAALRANGLDQERRALLEARLALALYWNPASDHERERLAREAFSRIDESAGWECRNWVESYRIGATWCPENLEERISASTSMVAGGVPNECRLMGYVFLVTSLVEASKYQAARVELDKFESLCRETSIAQGRWYPMLLRAMFLVEEGRFEDALGLGSMMVTEGSRAGDDNAVRSATALDAMCQFHRGPSEALVDLIRTAVGDLPSVRAWRTALTLVLVRTDKVTEAIELYHQLLSDLGRDRRDLVWLVSAVQLAEACVDLDDIASAERLLELLKPFVGRRVPVGYGVVTWGSVDRVVGRLETCLGRTSDAITSLREAVRRDREVGSWAWLSYSYLALAEAEGKRNGREGVERRSAAARRARNLAVSFGQRWIQEQAERLL